MPLRPELTALDRKVLECLPAAEDLDRQGVRAYAVARRVIRPGRDRVETTPKEYQTVLEILRGLEAVGLAWNDNGWWRRA